MISSAMPTVTPERTEHYFRFGFFLKKNNCKSAMSGQTDVTVGWPRGSIKR